MTIDLETADLSTYPKRTELVLCNRVFEQWLLSGDVTG